MSDDEHIVQLNLIYDEFSAEPGESAEQRATKLLILATQIKAMAEGKPGDPLEGITEMLEHLSSGAQTH